MPTLRSFFILCMTFTLVHATTIEGNDRERLVQAARAYIYGSPLIFINKKLVDNNNPQLATLGYSNFDFRKFEPFRAIQVKPGHFVVSWVFGEECEYRGKGKNSPAGWFLKNGSPCLNNRYSVDVTMGSNDKGERIDITPKMQLSPGLVVPKLAH
jgi:hypothetical protein